MHLQEGMTFSMNGVTLGLTTVFSCSLAIEFALETSTASSNASLQIKRPIPSSSSTPNPYILPFSMRGILEEEYVRRELNHETTELLRLFDEWKPATKVLKDVKFRLEGIRSRL